MGSPVMAEPSAHLTVLMVVAAVFGRMEIPSQARSTLSLSRSQVFIRVSSSTVLGTEM